MIVRWLCIEFPRWPIQRWVRDQMVEADSCAENQSRVVSQQRDTSQVRDTPQVRADGMETPIVLHVPDARRGQRVECVSVAAQQLGIVPGMAVAEASALVAGDRRRVVWRPADPQRDRERLLELAEECRQFTPLVCWSPTEPVSGLGLQIQATAGLWGSETALLDAVAAWVARHQLLADLVIADTLSAASAWARWGPVLRRCAAGTLRQILATGIAPDELRELPLQALQLPEQLQQVLHQLGLDCLGQLWQLPRAGLNDRFGSELTAALDRLVGHQSEVVQACPQRSVWEESWEGEYPVGDLEGVLQVCQKLWGRLAERLQALGEGALQVVCQLRCVEGEQLELTVGMFTATADQNSWIDQLRVRAERLALPGPVARVRLIIIARQRVGQRVGGLWDDPDERLDSVQQQREWGDWVTRVTNRLGSDRVLGVVQRTAWLPEDAWRAIPWTGPERATLQRQASRPATRSARATRTSGPSSAAARRMAERSVWSESNEWRPLWLRTPTQVTVMVAHPQGLPAAIVLDGISSQVRRAIGPERVETGWWRGACVRRDYYQLHLHDGRRLWVFYQRPDGPWFLHGYFG